MIVADTNTVAYLYLPSAYSEHVEKLFQKDPVWAAPLLWRSELRNILATYMRKGLISLNDAIEIQEQAESLMRENEYEVNSRDILRLAEQTGCTAYDCEFVCLAKTLGTQLITADKKLLRIFPTVAVTALESISCSH